uniref:Gamma-glutamyltransferase n=1 Tax=Macrostomum lignano TaxID=282301 RepID=A0A1I8JBY0_9PLAT
PASMSEGDKTNLVNQTDEGADPNNAAGAAAIGADEPSSADKPASSSPLQRKLRCPPPRGMTLIVLVSVIFSAAVTLALILTIIFGEPQVQRLGAVAADTTEAGKCGLEMLTNGGSAVDAAVAAALCNAVIQYPITGLGGGGLMLVHSHRADKTTLFDFLETAPATVTAKSFAAAGGESRALFAPAIRLATSGFHMPADVHLLVANNAARLAGNPLLKRVYLTPSGAPKPTGTLITMPELAGALKFLRDQGANAMYSGSLSAQLLSTSSDNGGFLAQADLTGYKVQERTALVGHYRNFTIRTFPPPSSGGAYTLLLAQVLAGYPASSNDLSNSTGLLLHRFAEAAKFALGAVQSIGESSTALAADLSTPAYADRLRSRIADNRVFNADNSTAYAEQPWPQPNRPLQASSSLVAVDNDELYVSMETSINTPFAAGLTTSPNGILLNNALANFDLSGGSAGNHSNAPAGGRRPATLMSPSFAFNPRQRCGLRFAFGASNSTAVPSVTAWLAARLSDLSADTSVCPHVVSSRRKDSKRQPCLPLASTDKAPRVNPLLPPDHPVLESESRLPTDIGKMLTAMGHKLVVQPNGLARAQLVAMDMYSLAADSDLPRSGAVAALLPQNFLA